MAQQEWAEMERLQAEIDELRAENERLEGALSGRHMQATRDALRRAREAKAEAERLRETLKHIAEADVALFTGKPQRPSGNYCVDVARRALASDEIRHDTD